MKTLQYVKYVKFFFDAYVYTDVQTVCAVMQEEHEKELCKLFKLAQLHTYFCNLYYTCSSS